MPKRIVEMRFVDGLILWMLDIQAMYRSIKDPVAG
jgi:hypothetical protein